MLALFLFHIQNLRLTRTHCSLVEVLHSLQWLLPRMFFVVISRDGQGFTLDDPKKVLLMGKFKLERCGFLVYIYKT